MPSPIIDELHAQFNSLSVIQHLWVAYSGGVDSHVLLHALTQLQTQYGFSLHALHVNHGLSANATAWSNHCMQICQALGIDCDVLTVKILKKSHSYSIEEAARNARYDALHQHIQAVRKAESGHYLVTGHHADDQAETFLLQLLRGAGTRGLSAMPTLASFGLLQLWRPLLRLPQTDLMAYATDYQLHWVEDDSNAALHFDRNYLRHQVMPTIKARWPHMASSIYQSTQHCAQAENLLQTMAADDLARLTHQNQLNLIQLTHLSTSRRHNALRFWLQQQKFSLPSRVHLAQLETHFMTAKPDANPKLSWGNVQLRRYQNWLYALPRSYHEIVGESLPWKLHTPCVLPFGLGSLVAKPVMGQGICLDAMEQVEVRFRQGGEMIHPLGYAHSRPLKKWLQDWQIPPWQRGRIPLVYVNATLAQMMLPFHPLCIAKSFAAKPDEMGWEIKLIDEGCNTHID